MASNSYTKKGSCQTVGGHTGTQQALREGMALVTIGDHPGSAVTA